jgi:hypothetical protein
VSRQDDIAHDWKISLEERIDHALPDDLQSNNGVTLPMRRASEVAAILTGLKTSNPTANDFSGIEDTLLS